MADETIAPLALVAPELVPALDTFPDLDFVTLGPAPFRGTSVFDGVLPARPPELEAVICEERFAPGADGAPEVRMLVYSPPQAATAPRAALLHIHGGGYVIGAPEQNDVTDRETALALDCVIVSPAYRLAPETTWPGALEDCFATLKWLNDNAGTLGIDPSRIAVAGSSAGGGHAAALALHARNQGGPAIRLVALDAPMLDDRTATAADPNPYTGHFVWSPEKNSFGWGALLGMEPGGADVPEAAVPARASDLSGLPPTFITVGALDLLVEEDMEFVRRLARAGVPVELHVIPGAYHGFAMARNAPQARQVTQLRLDALARAFA